LSRPHSEAACTQPDKDPWLGFPASLSEDKPDETGAARFSFARRGPAATRPDAGLTARGAAVHRAHSAKAGPRAARAGPRLQRAGEVALLGPGDELVRGVRALLLALRVLVHPLLGVRACCAQPRRLAACGARDAERARTGPPQGPHRPRRQSRGRGARGGAPAAAAARRAAHRGARRGSRRGSCRAARARPPAGPAARRGRRKGPPGTATWQSESAPACLKLRMLHPQLHHA
jgi:hypothetical protein